MVLLSELAERISHRQDEKGADASRYPAALATAQTASRRHFPATYSFIARDAGGGKKEQVAVSAEW